MALTLALRGVLVVDAPLGGDEQAARVGRLTALVGASTQDYALVRPVLRLFAADVMHSRAHGFSKVLRM